MLCGDELCAEEEGRQHRSKTTDRQHQGYSFLAVILRRSGVDSTTLW